MAALQPIQHPGQLLLSEITKIGMSQRELAARTGVTEKHISTVINGSKDLSASFARKLDIALGSESGFWAKRQTDYDQYMVIVKEENNITQEELTILKSLSEVVSYLTENKIMHNDCCAPQKVLQLRNILRVSDLESIPKITYNAAYRAQVRSSTNIDVYVLFAWQRICEIMTEKTAVKSDFDAERLKSLVPEIIKLMSSNDINDALAELRRLFASCGVAFQMVRHFRGAPVQGFIKQVSDNKVILCVTIRGKKADRFWFSLFHEIGHLVNGDLDVRFVDFDSVKSATEEAADMFARNALIPDDRYKSFVRNRDFSLAAIKQFSKSIGVPYWITIGRLLNDEWREWSYYANEIPSYEWAS